MEKVVLPPEIDKRDPSNERRQVTKEIVGTEEQMLSNRAGHRRKSSTDKRIKLKSVIEMKEGKDSKRSKKRKTIAHAKIEEVPNIMIMKPADN